LLVYAASSGVRPLNMFVVVRPHRSTTYIDVAYLLPTEWCGLSVCLSVGLSVILVSPAKTAELNEMPFGLRTRMGRRNHVLGVHIPPGKRQWPVVEYRDFLL